MYERPVGAGFSPRVSGLPPATHSLLFPDFSNRFSLIKKERKTRIGEKTMKGRVFLPCLFLLLATVSAWGQSTGAIVGVVKDQTGAMLPGVSVTVANTATRESRQVITDES